MGQCLILLYGSGVVAEDVHAEVLEVLAGQGDVGEYALAALALGAAQQAHALEIFGYILGGDVGGDSLLPMVAQGGGEGLYAAAELHLGGGKQLGKLCQLLTIHVMCLEPQGVDMLLMHHLADEADGPFVQLHGRARVDDIEHAILPRHLTQYGLVHGKGIIARVAMVVAEGTLPPAATRALQQHKLARHLGVNEGIPIHLLMFYILADGVHGGVGQWRAEDSLDD